MISKLASWRRKASGSTLSALISVAILGLAPNANAIDASAGNAHPAFAKVTSATALRAGDNLLGALPANEQLHIAVALKLRNRSQLDSFITAANTPNSVMIKHTLSPDEIAAQHAPTAEQAQRVANFLISSGFQNVEISSNRMLVSADGAADIAQRAFSTSFARVQSKDGRQTYANISDAHIPAELQDAVLSVIGLQNVHQAHTFLRYPDTNTLAPAGITGHNPVEFSSIYGGTGVPTAAGVTVGIITQGKITQTITDLNTFTSQNGLATVTTQTVNTNGTSTDTSGLGEWSLDSQDIVGMGGGQVGKIIFYNIPTLSNTNLTADVNAAVTANATKIINVSLGECETDAQGDGSAAAQDQLYQTAMAQGQTFSVSTGDSGADECSNGGITPSYPASSPYVVAVGGTTLNATTTTYTSETVWSGGGGSPSTFEPRQSWQSAVVSGTKRTVPDVSFDADPNSGAKVIVSGASQQIGGTSLAAPLFSGSWARILAAHPGIGFAAPLLYQKLTSVDYHDVTSGSNGGESATVGYDKATGFGSFILSNVNAHIATTSSNNPPVANFSVVTSALVATFTDSSTDSDGSIASRSWNFGDSSTSTAANPSHTYAAAGTYSVSLTVTDNGGATNTKTASVTVASGGGGGGNVLTNGVAVTGLSATTGNKLMYTLVVPAGATNLNFVMSGGTGDADLYVKFGSAPTTTSYDCRPYVTGNSESCPIATAQAGTYYVMINAYASFTGVSLTGSYSTGGGGGTCGGTVLCNNVAVTGLSGTTGTLSGAYTFVVPAGATNATIAISGGTGDADLYVKLGSAPTTTSYTCRPYVTGNTESCTLSGAGTYYVKINAYSSYTGVSLVGKYTP